MREIKFRAWYPSGAPGTQIREVVHLRLTEGKKRARPIAELYGGGEADLDQVMQYTGLKDNNGKEIYEGDILKHDLWGITQIIWEHGMFRGTNGKEWNEMVDATLADHQLQRCRIIGNIYENPELIKA